MPQASPQKGLEPGPGSSSSSSIFSRFRRQHSGNTISGGAPGSSSNAVFSSPSKPDLSLQTTTLSTPGNSNREDWGGAVEFEGGKVVQHDAVAKIQHSHRRDSSLLSLTSSVTDSAKGFGANVKRSVSLRSHRTTLSASGSSFGKDNNNYSTTSPTTGLAHTTPLSSARAASPDASPVQAADPRPPLPTPPATAPAHQAPILKRKISLTAKGLTRKFQSTEALPALNSPAYLESVGAKSPPVNDRYDPMLATPQPLPTPGGRKTSQPDHRPGLPSQTSFTRESPSSHGNVAPLQHAPSIPPGLPAGPLNPHTIYTQIHETSTKRMATIEYLRKLYEGDIFYFGTVHYSQDALHALPSMQSFKLGRRATNYFLLGYSLPAVLDMNAGNPLEYLKALSNLLTEFETYQNLSGFDASGNVVNRNRMGQMFKSGMGLGGRSGKGRRSSTAITPGDLSLDTRQAELLGLSGGAKDTGSPLDMTSPINPTGHEFSWLLTPHIPFEPDFSTTLGTLCDTLIDTYARLMDLVSGPDTCNVSVGEAFTKADKAIRKILVANVVKEFEDTARATVKGEMAGLGKLALGGLM